MSDRMWIIIRIDAEGKTHEESAGLKQPLSGDTHLHIEDGRIIAIHALAEYRDLAKDALLIYWNDVENGRITLENTRQGEARYDMSLLEALIVFKR